MRVPAAAGKSFAPGRLDRYLVALLPRPFLIALAVLLLVLLLERLLRLFDLAASSDDALRSILLMSAHLVPHYLGLALPAALFFGLFVVVVRLSDNNELDAMLASGYSIARLTLPFFVVAVMLAVFGYGLYGYLQPYGRYHYHVVVNEVLHAGWDARVQEQAFVEAGRGIVLSAEAVDRTGRELQGVFLRRYASGEEQITTARRGSLRPSADGSRLLLDLREGQMLDVAADGELAHLRFGSATFNEDFSMRAPAFRARGDSERELTLPELWSGMRSVAPSLSHEELASELYGRLARVLSLPLLPLLAVPLGIASKRGRRLPGLILANVLLFGMHQGVQFGESLAETGQAPALFSVWLPFAVFVVITLWLFLSSLEFPGDNPASRAVQWVEDRLRGLRRTRPAPT